MFEIGEKKKRYFIAIHPYMRRCGERALITGTSIVKGRECYDLLYDDGITDKSLIINEDSTGKGGEGVFYIIES